MVVEQNCGYADPGLTVYGAYEYDVEYIINGGAPFNFSPGQVKTNRWDSRWVADGWS